MHFNAEQKQAILHKDGPAMVLAGPGSGKTAVIIHRIQSLIHIHQIPPEQILVITYTRAAADGMKKRYLALENDSSPEVSFGTFHSIFYKILRVSGGLGLKGVVSPAERLEWLRSFLQALPEAPPNAGDSDFLEELAAELTRCKAEEKRPQEYRSRMLEPPAFARIFAAYAEQLRASGKMDFEDMLLLTRDLLSARPALLEQWRERFRYILVDEFQDINGLQYEILRLLAEPERNLFIVGDDDQSIYRFRGAKPEIMLRFPADYPDCRTICLRACYRCSPEILQAALRLVGSNSSRYQKVLRSEQKKGPAPRLACFADPGRERRALLSAIREEAARGTPLGRMAVLYRTNYSTAPLISLLQREGIPVSCGERPVSLYRQPVARDIFAYLELANGSRERSLFLRVINKPLRYLSRDAFRDGAVSRAALLEYYADKPYMQERVLQLFRDLERLSRLKPFAAVEYIRREMGYEAWLRESVRHGGRDASQEMEQLEALEEDAEAFPDYGAWRAFAREAAEQPPEAPSPESPEDALVIGTMHGAKGLEYDAVFLPELNAGTVPHRLAKGQEALEEERRILYVAMTRARYRLWMSFVRSSRAGKAEPSPFLKELFSL